LLIAAASTVAQSTSVASLAAACRLPVSLPELLLETFCF
jgi:hypothetical protein